MCDGTRSRRFAHRLSSFLVLERGIGADPTVDTDLNSHVAFGLSRGESEHL